MEVLLPITAPMRIVKGFDMICVRFLDVTIFGVLRAHFFETTTHGLYEKERILFWLKGLEIGA